MAIAMVCLMAAPAWATQTHGDPEGLYVHQISHLFFLFSMGLLIYWLRARKLDREPGWKCIQYAAIFFMLWTVDAFIAHFMDEQYGFIRLSQAGPWHIRILAPDLATAVLYYIVKLDHLLCVPAMLFLYLGLRRLNKNSRAENEHPGEAGK